MNENMMLALALVAGILLGLFFFGGLWWTVRQGIRSKRPGLWFFSSLLVRSGAVLAGFYWLAADHWQRLLVCLLGFTLGRIFVSRLARNARVDGPDPVKE